MEAARKHLTGENSLLEVDPQRVKGKAIPVKLWTVNGNVLDSAA